MKKLTISFIEPHVKVVGGIRRIIEFSNRLQDLGHDVRIFTPTGKPCAWLKLNAPIYKLSKMHRHEVDICVFNLAEQYNWAIQAKAKRKIFLVLAAEATYKDPRIPLEALKPREFYFATNSTYTRNYILKYRKKIKYEIPILPGGINPNHFHYEPSMPKTYDVLYYGSPRPWKGTSIIQTALAGENLKILKMEGKNTPQNKMYQLYNMCTIFVAACQSEGFSMPELEAMKCGCPVVCTDSGGNRDFVVNGENAMVVNRTVLGVKSGIKRLLKNKGLRSKFKQAGLKTANEKRFDWGNITKKFEDFLYKIM